MKKYGVAPLRLSQAGVSAELLRRSVQDSNLRGHSLLAKPDADVTMELADAIDEAKMISLGLTDRQEAHVAEVNFGPKKGHSGSDHE